MSRYAHVCTRAEDLLLLAANRNEPRATAANEKRKLRNLLSSNAHGTIDQWDECQSILSSELIILSSPVPHTFIYKFLMCVRRSATQAVNETSRGYIGHQLNYDNQLKMLNSSVGFIEADEEKKRKNVFHAHRDQIICIRLHFAGVVRHYILSAHLNEFKSPPYADLNASCRQTITRQTRLLIVWDYALCPLCFTYHIAGRCLCMRTGHAYATALRLRIMMCPQVN